MKRVALMYYILVVCLKITLACDLIVAKGDDDTYFEKSVYRATIIDDRIVIVDEPIKLSRCNSTYHLEFEIAGNEEDNVTAYLVCNIRPDETKYDALFASYSKHDCNVLFYGLVRENITAKDTLYDVLTLTTHDYACVVKTNIIILANNSSEYDPYKLVYTVNGTEYVILNYFYFKIFLLLIVAIGILILVLEIREIVLKYKGNTSMYVKIDDQINYM